MKKYNSVYGKYSMGGGGALDDPDGIFASIEDPEILSGYKKSLRYDLNRLGISIDNKIFLDVGTGADAIAACELGAKKVYHYDISETNVRNLRSYIKKYKPNISTHLVDLVEYKPQKADLVYLHGIVQHFSHTGKGLKNCLDAVIMGGYVWLYFYRSGTFTHFVVYLLRDLMGTAKNIDEYFFNSTILYSKDARPNYFVSGLMDNFFVDYIHLYHPKTYLEFLRQAGFEMTFASKLEPLDSVNHSLHESVIVGAKRVRYGAPDITLLEPKKSINQLAIRYVDMRIAKTVEAYKKAKKLFLSGALPASARMIVVFKIFEFLDLCNPEDVDGNHRYLQTVFTNLKAIRPRK